MEIITRGGIVGNDMEQLSHNLELNEGYAGIFTAIPNTAKFLVSSSLPRFKAYAGVQGFIRYDLQNGSAKDQFRSYKSISSDVYSVIQQRTKLKTKILKQPDFKIK